MIITVRYLFVIAAEEGGKGAIYQRGVSDSARICHRRARSEKENFPLPPSLAAATHTQRFERLHKYSFFSWASIIYVGIIAGDDVDVGGDNLENEDSRNEEN